MLDVEFSTMIFDVNGRPLLKKFLELLLKYDDMMVLHRTKQKKRKIFRNIRAFPLTETLLPSLTNKITKNRKMR